LQALDVTHEQIEAAVTRFGTNTGGGFVDQHGREYLIRNVGLTRRLEDLRNTGGGPQAGPAGLPAPGGQVDFAPRVKRGDAGFQGKPAVIVSIQKQPGADTVDLTGKIEAALAEIQKTLPQGVSATNLQFRQATFIETSVDNVKRVLLEAAGVVAVILILFLMNWRATAISLTAIPISILVTVLVFYAFGLTINTMTLGGLAIAIGELVDDAVVDVENILRPAEGEPGAARAPPGPGGDRGSLPGGPVRHRLRDDDHRPGVHPALRPLGHRGRLFAPLGVAYIVSILASLITSITVTPVLAYYLLSGRPRATSGTASWSGTSSGQRRPAALGLRAPGLLFTTVLLGVGAAAYGATLLPRTFLPPFNEGTLTISLAYNPASHSPRAIASARSRRLDQGRARGDLGRAPHGPRRARRACEGCALLRDRRRPEAVGALEGGGHGRHPRPPGRPARDAQRRPADLAPPRPHALGRAGRDRAQDLR
jgi:HME family heavy-metal exporter